jgi:membrane-bound lytic murein transglycosylase MltF
MSVLTYDQVHALVTANNQSTTFSTELLVCQIWKESSFNPNAVNGSHRGLMQISPAAVQYVNANTPHGVHFTHDEMFDPARNIQCGTWYLRKRQEHEHTDVRTTLNNFCMGAGYADNILTCAACLQVHTGTPQPCLNAIHH